jgi:putative heme-binding domain-containing protein
MIRVAHSFFGADHGYPYLYDERPDEALAPLADLGRGSSAGGLCYLDTALPDEFRGNLFFCEWGRAVMRSRPVRAGSSFAPLAEIEFAAGAQDDPYGFKPTDLTVAADGALIVVDWADGQRPKRGRGRVYRIVPKGKVLPPPPSDPSAGDVSAVLARLDAERESERGAAQAVLEGRGRSATASLRAILRDGRLGVRGRLHAVWVLANVEGTEAIPTLLELAQSDPEPRVRAQAVRAIADRGDPILAQHRLDAGRGEQALCERLAALCHGPAEDPRILLEVVIALGRLRWTGAPDWLRTMLVEPDPALSHAAMQTLRRSGQWNAILKLLDEPGDEPIRRLALRALAGCDEPEAVDGLIARLGAELDPKRRREYADLLTRVAQKPGPWVYWGYRPAPRAANHVRWQRTGVIEEALDRVLTDPDRSLRLAVLRRMEREQVAIRRETLDAWLRAEHDAEAVAALLEALRRQPLGPSRGVLEALLEDRVQTVANRKTALELWVAGLRQVATGPDPMASSRVILMSSAPEAELRAAALGALAALGCRDAGEPVRLLLSDPDLSVRRAAASAAGQLGVQAAVPALLNLARDAEPGLRGAALDALRLMHEPRALSLAVAALGVRETQLAALECLDDLGGPEQLGDVVAVATNNPPVEVLHRVVRLLTRWAGDDRMPPGGRSELDRALARVQGASGILARWQVAGPFRETTLPALMEKLAASGAALEHEVPSGWSVHLATGLDARLRLKPDSQASARSPWLACAELDMAEAAQVQFLGSSGGRLRVWLNGEPVYLRDEERPFVADSDRFDVALDRGPSRLFVAVTPATDGGAAEFHLRFRRKGSTAEHERLMQLALTRPGNAERGRALFLDLAKSQCLKCHRFQDQGARIGPDLSSIGSRFPRAYLIESVLEPSRTIAPSYETVAVALNDGRVLTGVRTAETESALTLADAEGRAQVLPKAEIEAQRLQTTSLMPEGLEKQLTPSDFVDLISFLASQK